MSISPGLRNAIVAIALGVYDGTLDRDLDYGVSSYDESLRCNGYGDADEILATFNEEIQRLSGDKDCVVYADAKYLSSFKKAGLSFAYVSTGGNASSHRAKYFNVSGGPRGVYFCERASDEKIAEFERNAATSDRRHAQREAGDKDAADFLAMMRQYVKDVVSQEEGSLTDQQRDDVNYVTGVFPYDQPLSLFGESVNKTLTLEKIFAILRIVGRAGTLLTGQELQDFLRLLREIAM